MSGGVIGPGRLSPRQNMINMMYLVLTALLALNVSKEILDSFILTNRGLEVTNKNFEGKNENLYNSFENALNNDKAKVKPFYDKAMLAKSMADNLDQHIDDLKHFLIAEVDGVPQEIADTMGLEHVSGKDNLNTHTHHLIGSDPGAPRTGEWSATELRKLLEKYKSDLLGLLDPKVAATFEMSLNTDEIKRVDGVMESWELGNFYGIPFAACVTNLTKIQADVRNAESDIISMIYNNISAADFKFDTLAARVIPNSNYVIIGDTYRADVFVAAFSTTQNPVLVLGVSDSVGGFTPSEDTAAAMISYKRGVVKYSYVPKAEGYIEWGGVLKVKRPDGSMAPYPFTASFIAAKPTVVVSPDAMNVFYRGLDNPVSVSVPGFAAEELKVNMSNGSISGSKGKFKVRPGKGKECVVNVTAEKDGKIFRFGQGVKFRVKNVPDPKPYFAGISSAGGNVPRKKVRAQQGVIAKMKDFQFDLKFNVISFTMSATIKGKIVEKKSSSKRVTKDQKVLLNALKGGQKLYIEKIKAKGPDGTVRDLGTIVMKVI